MLQMERGLLPGILLKEHKARYIEALVESQEGGGQQDICGVYDGGNDGVFVEQCGGVCEDFLNKLSAGNQD